MKPFVHQELENCGFFSKLFGSTPTENAWKELNNLFCDAKDLKSISKEDVKKALKKWGVKASEENEVQRASVYRKIADIIFTEALTEEEFNSCCENPKGYEITTIRQWNPMTCSPRKPNKCGILEYDGGKH